MLGVLLLPVFTRLGHECQDLLSPRDGMHVCTEFFFFFGNGVKTHLNSKGKVPSTGKVLLSGGSNPRRCIAQDSEPSTLPTELFRPPPPSPVSSSVLPLVITAGAISVVVIPAEMGGVPCTQLTDDYTDICQCTKRINHRTKGRRAGVATKQRSRC